MTNDTMTKEYPIPNAQVTSDRLCSGPCSGKNRSVIGHWTLDIGHWNRSLGHWSFLFVFIMAAINLTAGVTEPGTVFYGKVVNRTSGQEYVMSEGVLTWVIVKPDGRQITLSGSLQPLNDGQFSYRLTVPHQALSAGLDVATNTVPLTIQPAVCSHLQIAVDGFPARIIVPGSASFTVAQSSRAATCRLDLEVFNHLTDADADGIPDWWANKYGVDDALADPDGDGLNNLAEFRAGTRPDQDNRIPTLATKELMVYADGVTGIRLRAIDVDSAPANLTYTLTAVASGGTLYLRNAFQTGSGSDKPLAVNDSFTQADVNQGRLIFVHASGPAGFAQSSFEVSLQDENAAHPASRSTVALNVYRPTLSGSPALRFAAATGLPAGVSGVDGVASDEQQLVMNYLASEQFGYVVWDVSRELTAQTLAAPSSGLSAAQYQQQYLPAYGPDRHQLVVGGTSDDQISGGMEADVLVAGAGNPHLRGNGGSDLFILSSASGNPTIDDFNSTENDAIDLSRVLTGTSTLLSDYVQVANSGSNSLLRINTSGAAGGYTNIVLTFTGVQLQQDDLYTLVDSGSLIAGNKSLPARISIVATAPAASENGPVSGSFTLSRTGPANSSLTVNLNISGSAINGTDYQWLPSQVTFASGQSSMSLVVAPYVDAVTELSEIVDVLVVSGAGYIVGNAARAQVTIEDLAPQISIETLEPLAVKSTLAPGAILVSRAGVLDRSVFIRLTISGTATSGTDYQSIPSFINLPAGQTAYVVQVTPKSTAVLSGGAESVQITVRTDATYKVISPAQATVMVVDEESSLGLWQTRNFPTDTNSPSSFATADTGATGIKNISRYAFQLDPRNPRLSTQQMPRFDLINGRLSVTFKHPANVNDIQYLVEVSNDLITWTSSPDAVEQYTLPQYISDPQMVSFRSSSNPPMQFMRVRVLYDP